MKAIKIVKPFEMKVVEMEKPVCNSGEVMLQLKYVGFCGSDLNTYRGRNGLAKMPVIPGHEIGAVIVEKGSDVPEQLHIGETVTVNPYTNCGQCPACRRRRYNACEHNETLGVQRDGAMREYITLPCEKVIPVGDITAEHSALIEPMSVGFHAVNRAQVVDTDVVLVIGCGMVGVGAAARCLVRGATVIACDLDDDKLNVVKRIGVQYVVNTAREDLHKRLMEITDGQMPDVIIEAVGSPVTQEEAVNEVSFTGRVVCIGYAKQDTPFTTSLFVKKELDIRGSRNALPEDFKGVIKYLERDTCPYQDLISSVVSPEDAPEAMANWHNHPQKVFRILVKF
jgi:2-desacetyl-2-hydroxyethyl bacteriochlorophyllide A dehydrogenase